MLDHYLRGAKDAFLNPLTRLFGSIHPTIITLASLVVGLAGAYFLTQQQYAWGLIGWGLNRILDGLDGTVARMFRKQSDLGGYLDILVDFVIYALIPVALVVGRPSTAGYLSLTFLLVSFYINSASWMYLSAILEKRARGAANQGELTSVTMPRGLIGGAETVIFYSLFILLPQHLVTLFGLMGGLVLLTVGQRLVWALNRL